MRVSSTEDNNIFNTRFCAMTSNNLEKAFGHNGYFKSLCSIVHFYNTRDVLPACPGNYAEARALTENCWPAPEVTENVNRAELGNLGLTRTEEEVIVAFLKTLSDGYVPQGCTMGMDQAVFGRLIVLKIVYSATFSLKNKNRFLAIELVFCQ